MICKSSAGGHPKLIKAKNVQIPLELARRVALNAHLLDGNAKLPPGKEGTAQTIESLGYVQIDTIAVIERAHHHTLWSRQPDYDPVMLHELQAKDRRVFEYWGHAASYLPLSDYRYYLPRMRAFPRTNGEKEALKTHATLMDSILERIRQEGALTSKDFDPPPGQKRGSWWDWKPAKIALELLFWRGDLMIAERRNFQRVYDLAERVLPDNVNTSLPDEDEVGRFFVQRALSAYGVAQERDIADHIRATNRAVISKALRQLVEAGQVIRLQLNEDGSTDYYALPESLAKAAELEPSSSLFLLSPFDNLIIQRNRIKQLFDFDYLLECYVPAARRIYGYFTLPILWREQLVGRLDPKADRRQKTLIIRNLVFEPDFEAFDEFLPTFAEKSRDLARFNRCEKVEVEQVSPAKIKQTIAHYL